MVPISAPLLVRVCRAFPRPRNAEVEQHHALGIGVFQKQVRWFDVAVHDPARVRDRERFADPPNQTEAFVDTERLARQQRGARSSPSSQSMTR